MVTLYISIKAYIAKNVFYWVTEEIRCKHPALPQFTLAPLVCILPHSQTICTKRNMSGLTHQTQDRQTFMNFIRHRNYLNLKKIAKKCREKQMYLNLCKLNINIKQVILHVANILRNTTIIWEDVEQLFIHAVDDIDTSQSV